MRYIRSLHTDVLLSRESLTRGSCYDSSGCTSMHPNMEGKHA